MEFFPQETRLTLYTTTKINPHFVPTLNGTVDMTYYNHGSKTPACFAQNTYAVYVVCHFQYFGRTMGAFSNK